MAGKWSVTGVACCFGFCKVWIYFFFLACVLHTRRCICKLAVGGSRPSNKDEERSSSLAMSMSNCPNLHISFNLFVMTGNFMVSSAGRKKWLKVRRQRSGSS
ncbi:hypothetical protein B0T20DRAFT_126404 [Sordaria brevicollis]|uniref:Uncharacterized protein n=1 Tax=Sordaria brevicollis TaxID=83679 RepID=A0AAE0PKZ2_SORBR|nr:hypothetical protein B0T20DRAFT_126404 [Sordaria brevicollis]